MPKPKPDKVVLHVKLDRATIRAIDMYAVERDLYRNEAAAELIRLGIEAEEKSNA
jgi:hypothetical protein